jgi:hypothetical protein
MHHADGRTDDVEMASIGNDFLLVLDYRNPDEFDHDILARMVRWDQPLQGEPFAVTAGEFNETSSAVTAGNEEFFVVWEDGRSDRSAYGIFGARVSPSGEVLDPDGIQLQPEASLGQPSVTSDGENFFVVWSGNQDIEGVVVSGEGELQPSGVQRIFSGQGTQTVPKAEFFEDRYYVAWEDWESEQIWGRTVNQDGTVRASAPFRISHRDAARNRFPIIGSNGRTLIVLWQEWYANREVDIAAAQIFPGATPRLQPFSITTDPGEQAAPALDALQNLYQVYYVNRAPTGLPRIKGRGVFVEPMPALEDPRMNANGGFTFRLSPGMTGRTVVVETSVNLRDWMFLGEADIGSDGEIPIPTDDLDEVPARYFRIRMEF